MEKNLCEIIELKENQKQSCNGNESRIHSKNVEGMIIYAKLR